VYVDDDELVASVKRSRDPTLKREAGPDVVDFCEKNKAAHPTLTLREAYFYKEYAAMAQKAKVTPKSLSSWLAYKKYIDENGGNTEI
jgi:hypothetical protein